MNVIAFGTDGIRGHADKFPFTQDALWNLGAAIARWIEKRYGNKKVRVLIGNDTRISCQRIKHDLLQSLMSMNGEIVDADVIPTPAVLQLIKKNGFDCGIMISASHNPYHDNGIKIFDAKTGKLTAEDEHYIENQFNTFYESPRILEKKALYVRWHDAARFYLDLLIQSVPSLSLHGITIVLDCAHGATYEVAPEIFKRLHATVIVLHNQPTGLNINEGVGALHLQTLQNAVLHHKADIGFAFDGDGDRVMLVNRDGLIKDGDDILALLLELPEYQQVKTVVGTIMTNTGYEVYAQSKDVQLIRTSVGDKYIAAQLEVSGALLGGEPSGHVILKNYVSSGDGILVALKVVEALQFVKRWDVSYITKFPQVLINMPVGSRVDLTLNPYGDIIEEHKKKLQKGRVLVRYSGTELCLRVMVEAPDRHDAQSIADSLVEHLRPALQ